MDVTIDHPRADLVVDQAFDAVVGRVSLTIVDERTVPGKNRITVARPAAPGEVRPPADARAGLRQVYGCNFPVAVGDQVLCPPTPLYSEWTTGVVTALDGRQYRGCVKHVRKVKKDQPEEAEKR